MFRLISALLDFLAQADHYSRIDPAHAPSNAERAGHRRIVAVALVFGLAGLLAGLLITGFAAVALYFDGVPPTGGRRGNAVKGVIALLAAGPLLGVVGTVFGAALACAFAPRAFYDGPVGRKWLELVGVEGVGAARFVCVLVVGTIAGIAAWFLSTLLS